LIIPKTIAQNSGFDRQETILKLIDANNVSKVPMGLNIEDGEPVNPEDLCIYDNYCVKQQFLNIAPTLS